MKVVIVNRYYPPYQSATGYHANELAKYLCQSFDVHIVTQKGDYNKHTDGEQMAFGNIKYVPSFFKSNWSYLRLMAAFTDSYFLIKAAKKIDADYYIILTDPPFLNLFTAKLLERNKVAMWSMDLYPDAFLSGEYVAERNPFLLFFKKIINSFQPNLLIALGKHQLSYFKQNKGNADAYVILPTGLISDIPLKTSQKPKWYDQDKIHYSYVGNIGEAHDLQVITAFADLLEQDKGTLVVSVYGQKSMMLKQLLKGKAGVIVLEYVPQSDLIWIDVQIVTLKLNWTNICVPSKGISALQMGQGILFVGAEDSDSWAYVKEAGWRIDPNNMKEEVTHFLEIITNETLKQKKEKAVILANQLEAYKKEAYKRIKNQISAEKQ